LPKSSFQAMVSGGFGAYGHPTRAGALPARRTSRASGGPAMHRRVVSLLATGAVVASLGVLATPGAAIAEDPPAPVPPEAVVPAATPIVSPTLGPPGTVISITVPGCTGIIVAAIGTADAEEALAFVEGPGPTVQLTVPAGTPQG